MQCYCFRTCADAKARPLIQMSIMDDSDIYVNVERPWADLESRERCSQRSGDAYKDFNQDLKTRHAAFSGKEHKERQ